MIPPLVDVGGRRFLAAAADVQEPAPHFASAVLLTIYQLGTGGANSGRTPLPAVASGPALARQGVPKYSHSLQVDHFRPSR